MHPNNSKARRGLAAFVAVTVASATWLSAPAAGQVTQQLIIQNELTNAAATNIRVRLSTQVAPNNSQIVTLPPFDIPAGGPQKEIDLSGNMRRYRWIQVSYNVNGTGRMVETAAFVVSRRPNTSHGHYIDQAILRIRTPDGTTTQAQLDERPNPATLADEGHEATVAPAEVLIPPAGEHALTIRGVGKRFRITVGTIAGGTIAPPDLTGPIRHVRTARIQHVDKDGQAMVGKLIHELEFRTLATGAATIAVKTTLPTQPTPVVEKFDVEVK